MAGDVVRDVAGDVAEEVDKQRNVGKPRKLNEAGGGAEDKWRAEVKMGQVLPEKEDSTNFNLNQMPRKI